MKTNEELQRDVQDAIKWERLLNAAEIGVTVKDGIVTLTGVVDNYLKKIEAEVATRNVAGVKAVIVEIEVRFCNSESKSDSEIARDVLNAFKWNLEVPNDKVKVKVENGWVTLEGSLQWNYEKVAANTSISKIIGIKGVSNYISISSDVIDDIEKMDIERAIKRNWSLDDKNIIVEVLGSKVTLLGTVDSGYQKEEAGRISWNAPGVLFVDNKLVIEDIEKL
jgi:osmotically-inducible protein OsmY